MERSRQLAIRWMIAVLAVVLLYACVLVFLGSLAESLFSWWGFGPDDAIATDDVRDYLRLPYMVLGAVMAGWAWLMIEVVRGPLREGSPWAWPFLARSLTVWFVLDTGMSVVLGHPTHALFNLPFALALGAPLAVLRPARRNP